MWLTVVLLLCSQFILGAANQALTFDADCDGQDIFDAVDVALRHYNDEKQDDNQFILHRITEARTRPENDGGTHYFVKYEIYESSCAVKSGKLWQECDYKRSEAETGACSAHVLINKELKINDVIFQNCSYIAILDPLTYSYYPCRGCWKPIDINSVELLRIVKNAIETMTWIGSHPFHFDLEEMKNASRQVVCGWNYKMVYTVRQTNCSKSEVPDLTPQCKIDTNGISGNCETTAYIGPNHFIQVISQICKTDTGFCLFCRTEVDPNDPELRDLLRQVIDEYNSDNNHTNLYNIFSVGRAKKEGLGGTMYDVSFTIKETNCIKSVYAILEDECQISESSSTFNCDVKFNVTNKAIKVHSIPQCFEIMYMSTGYTRGLTPLRMVLERPKHLVIPGRPQLQSRGPTGPNPKEEDKHGRKDKKEKRLKKHKGCKKHDHKKCDSSEEFKEADRRKTEVTVKPIVHEIPQVPKTTSQTDEVLVTTQQSHNSGHVLGESATPSIQGPQGPPLFPNIPTVTEDNGNVPNSHEDVLLDLPEAPKCPGKTWKIIVL
ncbi:T-kininogen 2-like isoform X1 [Ascaphus truei]|uniref:T-kininogen 2-like isoform X1 n=1 Tax=Ascaphus truei TaxID=8439 RepID=UPI003F598059